MNSVEFEKSGGRAECVDRGVGDGRSIISVGEASFIILYCFFVSPALVMFTLLPRIESYLMNGPLRRNYLGRSSVSEARALMRLVKVGVRLIAILVS